MKHNKPLNKINVVDVESTCWQPNAPDGMWSEIIEIGIGQLDLNTWEFTKNQGILVHPTQFGVKAIGDFCTSLTSITQDMVAKDGISFSDACKILIKDYGSKEYIWASFGDYDRKMFEGQCHRECIQYPFGPRHINVKTLSALSNNLSKEVEVISALTSWGGTFEGTHQRGVDDVKNTAKVLTGVMKKMRA